MCGIFCTIWQKSDENCNHNITDYSSCKDTIERRGPDYCTERLENLSARWKGFFAASVLWMQGPQLVKQPAVDADGNILLWNGDIFSGELAGDDVSDTQTLLDVLRTAESVPEILKAIKGPYSIVYYQASQRTLYFARDPFGRHSLLLKASPTYDKITLSSSATSSFDEYLELPAIGVFSFVIESSAFRIHPWLELENHTENSLERVERQLGNKIVVLDALSKKKENLEIFQSEPGNIDFIDRICNSIMGNSERKTFGAANENEETTRSDILRSCMVRLLDEPEIRERVDRVLELLRRSMKLRVKKKSNYCQNCIRSILRGEIVKCRHSKLGILFSGGLDSTLLAALADELVPKDESIDLVNVAFEKARKIECKAAGKNARNSSVVFENFDVPDRITGRRALVELQHLCPWRTWNFVECDVTQDELRKHRSSRIRDLVYPLSTVLDDSLGCALWFASRACGLLSSTGKEYTSPSRVLLVGMGADELFGGYLRHRNTLKRDGWPAMRRELDQELARISERNLGRDDRVISDQGRQARFPYLDEDFVEYVSSLNAWERCNPTESMSAGLGDKLLLRLAAHHIGLHRTSNFPKRALQFGSRIANSKENAKAVSQWV